MTACMHCIVSGRVQGVFFRENTRQRAHSLGLTGWTRNRTDGTVEVLACGAPDSLVKLQHWLRQGPDAAKVAKISCQQAQDDHYDDFRIHY
jgi:acylphosphatase